MIRCHAHTHMFPRSGEGKNRNVFIWWCLNYFRDWKVDSYRSHDFPLHISADFLCGCCKAAQIEFQVYINSVQQTRARVFADCRGKQLVKFPEKERIEFVHTKSQQHISKTWRRAFVFQITIIPAKPSVILTAISFKKFFLPLLKIHARWCYVFSLKCCNSFFPFRLCSFISSSAKQRETVFCYCTLCCS